MRLKLHLRNVSGSGKIPVNYHYPLSAAIYAILSDSSPEYATFLHDHGYLGADGKPRKLFTFSHLFFSPKAIPDHFSLKIDRHSTTSLIIASPMLGDFVQHFVVGLFSRQRITIGNGLHQATFAIEQVEALAEPAFTSPMRFKALSPIVLTTAIDTEQGKKTYYYRPFDEGLAEAVRLSLVKKFETVYGRKPEDASLDFQLDQEYIRRKGSAEGVSKLIHIREGQPDETRVKGFLAPFTLSGSVELMRAAWECGIGDKCSMGFGCVEVVGGNDR